MRSETHVNWSEFTPEERAVVALVRRDGELLLIRKKRGFGAGKINGPGGRIEPGETALQAAIRETDEETGLAIHDPTPAAELDFVFRNGYTLTVYVFVTDRWSGTPVETDEADPFWTHIDEIPYDEMWADDALWLPEVLAGRYVAGRFVFDGDDLLWSNLQVRDLRATGLLQPPTCEKA